MGMITNYVVQSYSKAPRGRLFADTPFGARDVAHARKTAERLAKDKPMVIAFVATGDSETGEFDEPKLIFAHGDPLPPEIDEMEKI